MLTYWDDGNTNSGDGWDATCNIEAGYEWKGGSLFSPDICTDFCGDGKIIVLTENYWDDGNTIAGDGWDGACKIEDNWAWNDGNIVNPSIWKQWTQKTCLKCNFQNLNVCSEWIENFTLSKEFIWKSNSLLSMSIKAETMKKLSLILTAISSISILGISIIKMSSPVSVWSMVNQFQLLSLLILTRGYIPDDPKGLLVGNKVFSFDLGFLHIKELEFFNELVSWTEIKQKDEDLELIGVDSGSSINNSFNIYTGIIALFIWSLLMKLIWWKQTQDSSGWVKKTFNWVLTKLDELFSYALIIRTMIESFQFLLLSNISNLLKFNTSKDSLKVSSVFSIVSFMIWIIFMLFSLKTYFMIRGKSNLANISKSKEYMEGLKNTEPSKLYSFISLMRRLVLIFGLLYFKYLNPQVLTSGTMGINVMFFLYIVIVKPFATWDGNVIEIINEAYLLILGGWLWHFNQKDQWNGVLTNIFIFTIFSNALIISLLILSKL